MEAIRPRRTIREHRIAAGLTQEQLAEKIGVHRPTIGVYETGDQEPSASRLFALAAALGVSADDIRLEEKRRAS